jgi:hypothetical protein
MSLNSLLHNYDTTHVSEQFDCLIIFNLLLLYLTVDIKLYLWQ